VAHAKLQLDDGGGPVSYTCAVHTTATAAARLRWASCVLVSRWERLPWSSTRSNGEFTARSHVCASWRSPIYAGTPVDGENSSPPLCTRGLCAPRNLAALFWAGGLVGGGGGAAGGRGGRGGWLIAWTPRYFMVGSGGAGVGLFRCLRQSAPRPRASIAVWLFFTVFWAMIAGVGAQTLSPIRIGLPDEAWRRRTRSWRCRASRQHALCSRRRALVRPEIRLWGCCCPRVGKGHPGAPLPLSHPCCWSGHKLTG